MSLSNPDEDQLGFSPSQPPILISLAPFAATPSSSSRRLVSSRLAKPSPPMVRRSRRQILAWVSLEGRLVGADEAAAAKTVDPNGTLGAEETLAWEMFTPMQRVLIVAVAASAYIRSEKDRKIVTLQKSVELRDRILSSMQEKLDNLCNYCCKDPLYGFTTIEAPINESIDSSFNSLVDTSIKGMHEDEILDNKPRVSNGLGPEERRMSDLSDWAPSIASSVDVQLDSIASECQINILRKEGEEKDITIKQLSAFIKSSEVLSSKRITELEDIIRRKNMIINKLRKDLIVLEQKEMNFSRLRRTSYSPKPPSTPQQARDFPAMADNLLYDMDCTTSPSSSDSDSCPTLNRREISAVKVGDDVAWKECVDGVVKVRATKEQSSSLQKLKPLKEKSSNVVATNSVPCSKSKPKRWV